jgi:hypothetical protein
LEVVGPPTGSGAAIRASGGGDVIMNSGGTLFFDGNYSYASGNYIRPVASNTQTFYTAGAERLRITPAGFIGIGTPAPLTKLDIRGTLTLESGGDAVLFTGTGSTELNRFLLLANATAFGSASGLKAGGVLVSDTYAYANPGKNDLIVKGNVGIGTSSPNQKLTVNGTIYGKEVKVDLNVPGPDYVFEKDYKLPSLDKIKSYIDQHKHLPEVPSAKEMEVNGINLSEMNMILLKKVEELTLMMIELNKMNKEMRVSYDAQIQLLQSQISQLKD